MSHSDEYAVIKDPTLLPTVHAEPAEYVGVKPKTLERESTIEDVCDFVVEYINSDVLVRDAVWFTAVKSFICDSESAGGQASHYRR